MAFDHRDGASGPNPYAAQMGRTFASLELTGPLTVLDPGRAATLTAWVARLIPGNADWPSAADLDTVNYIDEIVRQAPTLRPVLIGGIDAADAAARSREGVPFSALEADRQTTILRDLESTGAPAAFSMVLELCYEAYYRSPRVQRIVAQRTGFEVRNTVDGKPMKPFPVERLLDVSARPDHYRSVNA